MSTWLMDTPLLKMLRPEKAIPLLYWCEAYDASLFISAASLTHVAQGIDKLPTSQSQGAEALRNWLDRIIDRFGDRIHPVDTAIARRAGSLLPRRSRSSFSRRPPRCDGSEARPRPGHPPRYGLRAPGLMLRLRSFS